MTSHELAGTSSRRRHAGPAEASPRREIPRESGFSLDALGAHCGQPSILHAVPRRIAGQGACAGEQGFPVVSLFSLRRRRDESGNPHDRARSSVRQLFARDSCPTSAPFRGAGQRIVQGGHERSARSCHIRSAKARLVHDSIRNQTAAERQGYENLILLLRQPITRSSDGKEGEGGLHAGSPRQDEGRPRAPHRGSGRRAGLIWERDLLVQQFRPLLRNQWGGITGAHDQTCCT